MKKTMSLVLGLIIFLSMINFTYAFGGECNDSDGGFDYYTYGSVKFEGISGVSVDYCTNNPEGGDSKKEGNYVVEFACNETANTPGTAAFKILLKKIYMCPFGCRVGACVSEEYKVNQLPETFVGDGSYKVKKGDIIIADNGYGLRIDEADSGYAQFWYEITLISPKGDDLYNFSHRVYTEVPIYSGQSETGDIILYLKTTDPASISGAVVTVKSVELPGLEGKTNLKYFLIAGAVILIIILIIILKVKK